MIAEMVLPLAVCTVLAVLAAAAHRRLPPAMAAHTTTVALVLVAVAAVPTVWVTSLQYLSHAPLVGGWFMRCAHALGHHDDVPHLVGLPAVAVSTWGLWRAARTLRLHRSLRDRGGVGLRIIDDHSVFAAALPGNGSRIVLSRGLKELLSPQECEVVIAHETAHAHFRHDRYLLAGQLAADLSLALGPVVRQLRFSLERWADEVAAQQCGDRRLVARTLGRVALHAADHQPVFAFAGLGVAARMTALLDPPIRRPRRLARVLLQVAVGGAAVFAVFQWRHLAAMLLAFCHT